MAILALLLDLMLLLGPVKRDGSITVGEPVPDGTVSAFDDGTPPPPPRP